MEYTAHYDRLILRARSRPKPSGYVEKHHVKPRSMGGDDDVDNLVWLTAREHFVAHELLAKIHGGPMWYALWLMSISKRLHSRQYEWIKPASRREMSRHRQGVKPTPSAIANRAAGLVGHQVSKETRIKISNSLAKTRRAIKSSDGMEYPSINEAERQTGIKRNAIRAALIGRSKTSGGLKWEYL